MERKNFWENRIKQLERDERGSFLYRWFRPIRTLFNIALGTADQIDGLYLKVEELETKLDSLQSKANESEIQVNERFEELEEIDEKDYKDLKPLRPSASMIVSNRRRQYLANE